MTAVASVSDTRAPALEGRGFVEGVEGTTLAGEPSVPERDLSGRARLTASAVGVVLGLVLIAACAGLGFWLAGAVFHSGALR